MSHRMFLALMPLAVAILLLLPNWTRAVAQSPAVSEADRIAKELTPPKSRSVLGTIVDPKIVEVVERMKTVRKTRGLSHREQDELLAATEAMPQLDLEIYFAFNSSDIDPKSIPTLNALGEALSREAFKSSTIIVGGHTDKKGKVGINQQLSDRRAQSVARYLADTYKIPQERILASGFGFRKLKFPDQPFADGNRRVQIANDAR
jgi:outer membrane protein OmpA-like peptidoglycan-associated protein